jgi:hypothetical protein
MHIAYGRHVATIAIRVLAVCALAAVWLASGDLQLVTFLVIAAAVVALGLWLYGTGLSTGRDRYDVSLRVAREM